jgi:opacity protein-like surface antigen
MSVIPRVLSVILLALYAVGAAAQSSGPRAGRWEFTLQPQYVDSKTVTGGNGSSANIESDWGFGIGLAYNFSNHLALGGELTWNDAGYRAKVTPGIGNAGSSFNLNGTMETSTLRMNGTWHLLASNFTPFVTGGIGATWVDTNIPNGPTQCWEDPWWGTYCDTPTRSNTYFSYNAGAGLRWDVNRGFFMSAAYIRQWIDVGGATGSPAMDQFRFSFGFKYN